MKKRFALLSKILFVLGFASFNSIIYILYKLNFSSSDVIDKSTIDYPGLIGYLIIILFYILAIFFLTAHFRFFNSHFLLRKITMIVGIISLFAIGGEKVLFDEIAREFLLGWEIRGELIILQLLLLSNMTFCLLIFALIYKTLTETILNLENVRTKDETIFTLAQYMGVISGIMGLLHTLNLTISQISSDKFWIYLPFYLLFLLPYIISVFYWLTMKYKENIVDWYDEKQWMDILKSALTTLLLSVPGMALFLLIDQHSTFYWFPYFLFMNLTLFSGSILYYYKLD